MSIQEAFDKIKAVFKRFSFGTKKQQIFLEDLASLISDGIPANRAIDMLSSIYSGISEEVALNIAGGIAEGLPLAESMRKWFNTSVVELVRAGEEGGTLEKTIHSAAESLKEKSGSIGVIIAALTYPLVVIIAGCIVTIYINNSILTEFNAIKPSSEWPAVGQALIHFANFLEDWAWLVVIGIIAGLFGLRYALINYVGGLRSTLDGLPVFALYKDLVAARIMETIGLLVANGVVFKAALKVLQYHATPYINSHLIQMEHLLGAGKENIAQVLDTGMVRKEDILRLQVIAETRGFEHALIRLGKHAADQGTKKIRRAARISASVLLAVGGGMIVFMIVAIYTVGMSLGTI